MKEYSRYEKIAINEINKCISSRLNSLESRVELISSFSPSYKKEQRKIDLPLNYVLYDLISLSQMQTQHYFNMNNIPLIEGKTGLDSFIESYVNSKLGE